MRMITRNETIASCIQLGANLSARVLVCMHIHIGVPRTDGTQQLRKFTGGNSLTSRTNDVCCSDDALQFPGRRARAYRSIGWGTREIRAKENCNATVRGIMLAKVNVRLL